MTGFEPDKYPVSYWNFDEGQINLTRYEYDSLDRLWKITDGENNTTERLYYPDGKLWKIVDAKNQDSVKYTYNPDGTLYSMADAKGNTTTYEYDGHIRLKKTTYPDPTKFEELSYDDAGRLNEKRTRADEIIGFDYDELNRLKMKTVPGNSITYEYDLLSRQINIIDDVGDTIHNDFDKAGRLESVTYTYSSLGDKTVWYEYDAAGNRIKLTYPDDGKYVRYHYDNLNRLVSICSDDIIGYWNFDEGEGDIAHDVVSDNDGTIYGASWTTGKFGGALSFNGEDDYVDTTYNEDMNTDFSLGAWIKIDSVASGAFGTVIGVIESDTSTVVEIIYDHPSDGDISSFIADNGRTALIEATADTDYTIGEWHHVFLVRDSSANKLYVYLDGVGKSVDDTTADDFSLTRPYYIGARNYKGTADQFFNGSIDEVMIFDRALTQVEIEAIYDGANQDGGVIVSYAYDALSARESAQYANGTIAEYYYNMADRLLSLDNQTNNENPSYDYSYDNVGNRLTMLVNGEDLHSYTYDNIYQLTEVDYPVGDDAIYNYDSLGNRTSVINGGSVIGYWKMDDNNTENTTVKDSSGNDNDGTASKNTSLFHTDTRKTGTGAFDFDGDGDCVNIGNDSSLKPSLPISVSMWVKPNNLGINHWLISNDGYTGSNYYGIWGYIRNTNQISISYGDGGSPGPTNRRSKVSTSTVSSEWQHIAFVIKGAVDMDIYINGTDAGGTYSGTGGALAYSTGDGTIGSRAGTAYFMDAIVDDVMIFDTALYSSNSLNQYTSVGGTNYDYDDNGNLTNINNGQYEYIYDYENRLTEARIDSQTVGTYSYDPLGRRISKTVVGSETTTTYYIYDGDQVICEYDGQGNLRKRFLYGVGIDEVVRMSQVGRTADISGPSGLPDGIVDIYDLRKMSESWLKNEGDAGFNADADLNYDEKINNTDSDILSANWLSDAQLSEEHFYYHYDGLGSVIALSDSAGRTVEMYEYDVYGNTIILAPTQEPPDTSLYGNPYMFTGRRFDTETRLYYYRARYYSTEIGRFLQTDPIGYDEGMNLYTYCYNNPVIFVDPSGEGLYKWLYTGEWNAPDYQYDAALEGAAEWLRLLSPVRGGYVSIGYTSKGRRGKGVGVATSWTMDSGAGIAVRGKGQFKRQNAAVGGQAGIKWNQEGGWRPTGQGYAMVDKGVVKIDEKRNVKFGFSYAGLILSTDKSRWYALADEWADIIGLDTKK